MTEAARAQYLGTEEARRGVQTALIADVATNYFQLRELDLELEIANQTRVNALNGLRLTTVRHDRGAATGLDVSQAEQFLYTAMAQIASIQREIGQVNAAGDVEGRDATVANQVVHSAIASAAWRKPPNQSPANPNTGLRMRLLNM